MVYGSNYAYPPAEWGDLENQRGGPRAEPGFRDSGGCGSYHPVVEIWSEAPNQTNRSSNRKSILSEIFKAREWSLEASYFCTYVLYFRTSVRKSGKQVVVSGESAGGTKVRVAKC